MNKKLMSLTIASCVLFCGTCFASPNYIRANDHATYGGIKIGGYNIRFKVPHSNVKKIIKKAISNQTPSYKAAQSQESVYNCSVRATLLSANTVAYTCSFPTGNVYKFTASVGLKGAFGYRVLSGDVPPCFNDPTTDTDKRSKLFMAAQNAGYIPQYAG